MDTLYHQLADNALKPVLGNALGTQLSSSSGRTPAAARQRALVGPAQGSVVPRRKARQGAVQDAVLRSRQGASCRTALWAAVDAAGNQLQAAQGTADVSQWKSDATAQRIGSPRACCPARSITNASGIQQ
jgi:hypothetical protein